jgi:hypothetical protein
MPLSHDVPGLDAPRRHQTGFHVRIVAGKSLDVLGIDPAEHDHGPVDRIAEGAGHHHAPRVALGRQPIEVGLTMRRATLEHVVDVVVEEDLVQPRLAHCLHPIRTGAAERYAAFVSNLEKRGSYTPRRVREQRAYRLAVAGGVTGTLGVAGLVLSVFGVIGAGWPIILIIIAAVCGLMFRGMTSKR